jgi:hypothetical protein
MAKQDPTAPVIKEWLEQAADDILKGVKQMFVRQENQTDRLLYRIEPDVRNISQWVLGRSVRGLIKPDVLYWFCLATHLNEPGSHPDNLGTL